MTSSYPRHVRLFAIGLAATVVLSVVAFHALHRDDAPAAPPIELRIAQSLGAAFNEQLDARLDVFRKAHPEIRVAVRYEPEEHEVPTGTSLTLGGSGTEAQFAGDYVVLVFNRRLTPSAPPSWAALIAHSLRLKSQGRVEHGIAIPDESYGVLPLLAHAFDAGSTASAEEAFGLLIELQFARRLVPFDCPTDCVVRMFRERKAAFGIVGEWRLAELERALGSELGVAALPDLPSGVQTRTLRRSYGARTALRLPDRERAAAREVVAFLSDSVRTNALAGYGKPALPLVLPAPNDTSNPAGVRRLLVTRSDAVNATTYARQEALVAPIWRDLRAGKTLASQAARALVDARGASAVAQDVP